MAHQSVPLASGGGDENRKIGNIFILNIKHSNPAAAAAARSAALAVGYTEKDLELKGRITLFPEVQDDPETRELSREALSVYLKLCPFANERYIWMKQLAGASDDRFIDPDVALREKTGRAARDQAVKAQSAAHAAAKAIEEEALHESLHPLTQSRKDAKELNEEQIDELGADETEHEDAFRGPRSSVEFTAEEATALGFLGANVGGGLLAPRPAKNSGEAARVPTAGPVAPTAEAKEPDSSKAEKKVKSKARPKRGAASAVDA